MLEHNEDLPDPRSIEEQKEILKKKKILSFSQAENLGAVPLSVKRKNLKLAVLDELKLEDLRFLSRYSIETAVVSRSRFSELFIGLYGEVPKVGEYFTYFGSSDVVQESTLVPRAIRVVDEIIRYALAAEATDIQLDYELVNRANLRFRIDGVLQKPRINNLERIIEERYLEVVSRFKIIAGLDIGEKRLPQDGVIRIKLPEEKGGDIVDMRIAVCRTIVQESISIRILDPRRNQRDIHELNHSPHVLIPMLSMAKSSAGMIITTGPTGSGKSTTLYGFLKFIIDVGIMIITAEDPIEYSIEGIRQCQVDMRIKRDFPVLLRSFLRQDPDVIMVGEIRDRETARIAFDAAQTGHLLLSTLHTNDSIGSISRFMDLGMTRHEIASSLKGVVAQRLVKTICPECRQEYEPDPEELKFIFGDKAPPRKFFQGAGCSKCHNGYRGRTVISELFSCNTAIQALISEGEDTYRIKQVAIKEGMKTMIEDGVNKLDGTTIEELIRTVPHFLIQEYRERLAEK